MPSYRDVAARGLLASNNSSGVSNPIIGSRLDGGGLGGFALARHDPSVLSTVVAAVMAVLEGGNQNQNF